MYPLERLIQLMEARKMKFAVANGILFYTYNRMIIPLAPAQMDCTISKKDAAQLLSKLDGMLVRWTDGFHEQETGWYAIICDQFVPVDEMRSKEKRETKKGITNCEVKPLDIVSSADTMFDVYTASYARYENAVVPVTREDYRNGLILESKFDDLIQYWGVYYEDKLVAHAKSYLYGNIEANITTVKLDPEYLKMNTANALYYRVTEHYVGNGNVGYINDGYRNLYHVTQVQEKLMRELSRRKAFTNLHIHYRQPYGAFIKTTYPLRNVIGKLDARVKALYKQEEITRYGR